MSLDSSSFLLIMTREAVNIRETTHIGHLTHIKGNAPASMPSAKIAKSWILGTRSIEFEVTYPLPVGALSTLIDGCARLLDARVISRRDTDEIIDFKGRDPQETLMPGIAAPRTDELLRVGGSIAVEEKSSDFDWEPFEVVCYTPFTRFDGTHHIVFTPTYERSAALPSWLPIRLLGAAAPIKPKFFRFGLQHFKSRMTFASLGYTPQVTESVLIDGVSDAVSVKLMCEPRRAEGVEPFSAIAAYGDLFSVINEATQGDILRDYRKEVEKLSPNSRF